MDWISPADRSAHCIPASTPVSTLEVAEAFRALSPTESLYALHLSRASWYGALINLFQCSPESAGVFSLIRKLFGSLSGGYQPWFDRAASAGITDAELQAFQVYSSAFLGNMGNYKSFGDTKFVPDLAPERFEEIVRLHPSFDTVVAPVYSKSLLQRIYSLTPRERQLGLGVENGLSTYFSSNCETSDAEAAQAFMTERCLSPYNTRLFKTVAADGSITYEIRLASAVASNTSVPIDSVDDVAAHLGTFTHNNSTVLVTRGDFAPLLRLVTEELEKAIPHAANDTQRQMLAEYVRSFRYGSIDRHKEGSRHWVKDIGPAVETYIGFIESYRDPFGVRGEWEGFVACVNRAMSEKFHKLVENAPDLLRELPWGSDYEKDTFLRPDFTSLDVISFASSGVPAGINIPNYDDVRQNAGFKNVALGNVLSAPVPQDRTTFLSESDDVLFRTLKGRSFEIQVGLHELLGHGSGKLFMEAEDGTLNFPKDTVKHPLTDGPVQSWYRPGESWDSIFPVIGSAYEECRAECVGIYLCVHREVLKIFGADSEDFASGNFAVPDIAYVNWLNMVRAGLLGLEFYTPETKSWRQAHMQARFAILQVLLEAGENLVSLSEFSDPTDGQPNLTITLDRSKIVTVGRTAIQKFLHKLQVYKSTADYTLGRAFFESYTSVTADMLKLRKIVVERKRPRALLVQANIISSTDGGKLDVKQYPGSVEGLIQSFLDRYDESVIAESVQSLAEAEQSHHVYN